jgi:hypothetical protein
MNVMAKRKPLPQPAQDGSYTIDNGSLVIPPHMLARFGNGDVERGRQELRLLIAAENDRAVKPSASVKPVNVRIGTPADEPAIMELLLQDCQENAAQVAVIDPERVRLHVQHATQMLGSICGVIDGPEGKPVAVCILAPMQWWFSTEWFYQEIVNYIHPDHRKSRYIHDLIAFEQWIGDKQSEGYGHRCYVLMGVLGLVRVREKIILYRRKMRQIGAAFLYPCPWGNDRSAT